MPTKKEDLPGTLKRSPRKAQKTYAETLDSAEEQYDSEARAHQTAWAAVKHSFATSCTSVRVSAGGRG
jgi:cation transport regulator ChaB